MTRALSYKFRFFTFVCIALLSYVHGYNLNETYLQPYTTINEPLTVTAFIEYLFANGLLRFRIPILFLISGYLYAQYDNRPYLQQVKRRFVSLIVPYLLWSAFALGLMFLLQQFDYTYTLVQAMKIDQMGDNRPYLQIGWWGMLQRWLLAPVAFQLWFIAGLFIYNLCYPFLRWAVVRMPKLWLLLCCLVFLAGFRFFWLEGQGLFFFSMGIWLQQKNIPIEKRPRWLSIGVAFILFVGLCIIKTFMAFECPPDESTTHIAMLLIYQAAVLCGVVTIWFGADGVVNWCMRQRWFQYASGFSFFIYGLHVPLLTCVMHLFMLEMHFVPLYRLLGYLFLPMLVVALCIGLGALLRHYAPYVYKLLTGGRGF